MGGEGMKEIELRAQKRCDADPWIEDHVQEALVEHERDALERAAQEAELLVNKEDYEVGIAVSLIAAAIRALKEE